MIESDITIGNKEYHVRIAKTEEEKEIGLSKDSNLSENEGMLFVYDEVQPEVYYTCEDMSFPIDIIFIGEDMTVISINSIKAGDPNPIYEQNVLFVLEVNINSDILKGDELEYYDDSDYTEEERKLFAKSKMLVLDENGNVQFSLESGERIFSIKNTKSLIRAALKAFHSDNDSDYKRVGRLVFKYLDILDNNDPQYVASPD